MKPKTTLSLFVVLLFLVSCDYGVFMRIKNCTNDSIVICYSNDSCIDSVKFVLDCEGVPGTPTDHLSMRQDFHEGEKLILTNRVVIPPNSLGNYSTFNEPLFNDNPEHKGNFFIIKLKDAKNHTWGEICRDTLYGKLIVTRKMVKQLRKQDPSNAFQWSDNVVN